MRGTLMAAPNEKQLTFNCLPKQVSLMDFNRYIRPFLSIRQKGPKPKISTYKTFNYILYVLHTGMQWNQLRTRRNEIHWSNVYKWHNRWSKDGSYEKLLNHLFYIFLTVINLIPLVYRVMVQTPL